MVFKQNKRSLGDDESCRLSYKHPRQLDYGSHLASFVGICNDIPGKPHPSGVQRFNKTEGDERFVSYTITELSVGEDEEIVNSAFGSISSLSWVTSSTSKEVSSSEPAAQISCAPGVFDFDEQPRSLVQSEEMYSSSFDYPPRKFVSVGPDHQADVPSWGLQDVMDSSGYLDMSAQVVSTDSDADVSFPRSSKPLSMLSSCIMDDNGMEKFMGTCIIPMPDAKSTVSLGGEAGNGKTDCRCLDMGSIRCVRQHVMEARERLREMPGQDRFMDLGFCDMGEDVAGKWSGEEEQVFHEVVFSNPASLGKNFWDHLSVAFPSRTKKELVSYYFNVFMLRRRAEQNRLDPLNVDSDNDEWQGSEDGDGFAMTEDDEDSAVESLVDQDDGGYPDVDDGENSSDNNDDGAVAGEDDDVSVGRIDNKSHLSKPFDGSHPISEHAAYNLLHGSEDQDVQDDSCTSFEDQQNGIDFYGPADVAATQESRGEKDHKHLHSEYGTYSLGSVVDHGFPLGPCDAKVWDVRFLTGPRKDIDFLPTCNVIEEVFGDGAWNENESKNGPGIM